MKTTALLAAAALMALAGTAQAQQARMSAGVASPLYGELGYSHLDVDGSGAGVNVSGRPGLLRGIIGYDVHPNAAIEGMLGFGVRDADFSGTAVGVPCTGDLRVRHIYGVFAKPKLDFGDFEVFGRLGYARTKVRTSVSVGGASASSSDSSGDLAYGLGANWRFSPRVYLGLDLMRYYDKDQTTVDGVTLSVGTRW